MKTITTFLLCWSSLSVYCCDNCNVYMSITPNDNKHEIGFFYRQRMMMGLYNPFGQQTMLKHAGHGNNPKFWGNRVTENYNTFELRGKIAEGNRLKTYVILPFVYNTQVIEGVESNAINGIGDPTIIQSVQVLDPVKEYTNPNFTQRFELGAGIKFPFGRTNKMINEEVQNLDLQPGSGSWDLLGIVKYWMKLGDFGNMLNVNYKWNGQNKDQYRYGNTFNATLNLFYQTKIKDLTLMPILGANVEKAAFDESTEIHIDTGGISWFIQGGLRLYYKGFALFGEYQKAVSNKFNGYTQLINKHKINLGLAYNI